MQLEIRGLNTKRIVDDTDSAKWHILIISDKVFLSYPKWIHAFVLPLKNII